LNLLIKVEKQKKPGDEAKIRRTTIFRKAASPLLFLSSLHSGLVRVDGSI
jgi:hypothetical protein